MNRTYDRPGQPDIPDLQALFTEAFQKTQTRLDGAETDAFLGQGSSGRVYSAIDAKGRKSAVKVICLDDYEPREAQKLIDTEKRNMILSKQSRHIVSVYDVQEIGSSSCCHHYLLIKMQKLSPFDPGSFGKHKDERVLKLAEDISEALCVCEKQEMPVLHRDIKPQNIFYDPGNDSYLLGDFGEAAYMSAARRALTMVGTRDYKAREVDGWNPYGFPADCYSLGMVLYRLANDNQLPSMEGGLPISGILPKASVPFKNPGFCGKALSALIMRMIADKPEDRFLSARELAHWIDECRKMIGSPEKETGFCNSLAGKKSPSAYFAEMFSEASIEKRWDVPANGHPASINDVFRGLEKCLRDLLTDFIAVQMYSLYGDEWEQALYSYLESNWNAFHPKTQENLSDLWEMIKPQGFCPRTLMDVTAATTIIYECPYLAATGFLAGDQVKESRLVQILFDPVALYRRKDQFPENEKTRKFRKYIKGLRELRNKASHFSAQRERLQMEAWVPTTLDTIADFLSFLKHSWNDTPGKDEYLSFFSEARLELEQAFRRPKDASVREPGPSGTHSFSGAFDLLHSFGYEPPEHAVKVFRELLSANGKQALPSALMLAFSASAGWIPGESPSGYLQKAKELSGGNSWLTLAEKADPADASREKAAYYIGHALESGDVSYYYHAGVCGGIRVRNYRVLMECFSRAKTGRTPESRTAGGFHAAFSSAKDNESFHRLINEIYTIINASPHTGWQRSPKKPVRTAVEKPRSMPAAARGGVTKIKTEQVSEKKKPEPAFIPVIGELSPDLAPDDPEEELASLLEDINANGGRMTKEMENRLAGINRRACKNSHVADPSSPKHLNVLHENAVIFRVNPDRKRKE